MKKFHSQQVALCAAAALVMAAGTTASAQTTVTWTGAAGNGLYSDPLNWNPPVVPVDMGPDLFNIVIPNGAAITLDAGIPANATVTGFSLGSGATLTLSDGRAFNVANNATINGMISATGIGASFNATGSGPIIAGSAARFAATQGSSIAAGVINYSPSSNGSVTLMRSADAGSLLDLSSIRTLQTTDTDTFAGGGTTQLIMATAGGLINLSGLQTITTGSAQTTDKLRFQVASGGSIDLSSLQVIDTINRTVFDVGAGQIQDLPSLTSARNMDVVLGSGATLNAPILASLNGGGLTVGSGMSISMPSLTSVVNSAVTLAGTGAFATGALDTIDDTLFDVSGGASFGSQVTDASYNTLRSGNLTLMRATDSGSALNLSSIQTLQTTDTDTFAGGGTTKLVIATDGGAINLSGLQTITTGSAQTTDKLRFQVASGGSIDLSSLQVIDTINRTIFDVGAGQTQDLPSLTSARNMDVVLGAGATLNAPNLTSLLGTGDLALNANTTLNVGALVQADNHTFSVSGGVAFDKLADQNYSSTGRNVSTTLLFADGSGSKILASAVESINAGFNVGSGSQVHTVWASNSGEIDLTGLRTITAPAQAADRLDFIAESNGVIRFGEINSIGGAGQTRFVANNGGRLAFDNLAITPTTNISIETVTSGLSVSGVLDVRGGSLNMTPGSMLDLGAQYMLSITDEASLRLDDNIVRFAENGTRNNPHFLEVGGLDLGAMSPGNDGNFGFGQLVLGTASTASVVALTDIFDNGNRGIGDAPESLYLFGFGGPDGLVLNSGSTLIIGNINTYLLFDGEWLHLNSLFGPGVTEIPFSEGFVVVPTPGSVALLGIFGLGMTRRHRHHN